MATSFLNESIPCMWCNIRKSQNLLHKYHLFCPKTFIHDRTQSEAIPNFVFEVDVDAVDWLSYLPVDDIPRIHRGDMGSLLSQKDRKS